MQETSQVFIKKLGWSNASKDAYDNGSIRLTKSKLCLINIEGAFFVKFFVKTKNIKNFKFLLPMGVRY